MAKKQSKSSKQSKPVEQVLHNVETPSEPEPPTGTNINLTKNLPKAVEESVSRPDPVEDTTNDELNKTYPWCVAALTTPQRAILCELIRIRKALEAK